MTTRLYYAPRSRAFTALWLLEELGQPYELESVALGDGRHKKDDYLALNPMGKVPLVVHDEVPVSETGAIALYLADRFGSDLAPRFDDADRPAFLRWLFFAGGVMEPAFGEKIFKWDLPASSVAWGSFADMERMLTAGVTPGPWLLGERFSVADVVVGATARFGVMFGVFDKAGPVADYVSRLTEREAFKRAEVIEAREGGEESA